MKKKKNGNFHFLKKLKNIFENYFTLIKLDTFSNIFNKDFGIALLVSEKMRNIFFQIAKIALFSYFFKKIKKKKTKLVNYKQKIYVGSTYGL